MNAVEKHVRACIRYWVWGGYHDQRAVEQMIEDVIEEGVDPELMPAVVAEEFARKAAAEAEWPAKTDCDKLDQAFMRLDAAGVCAVQNAGYTMSDGHQDVAQALDDRGRKKYRGYCFFHGQDLERAIDGRPLMIAFGRVADNKEKVAEIGRRICDELKRAGLVPKWDGDIEKRIEIPSIDWKRRY